MWETLPTQHMPPFFAPVSVPDAKTSSLISMKEFTGVIIGFAADAQWPQHLVKAWNASPRTYAFRPPGPLERTCDA